MVCKRFWIQWTLFKSNCLMKADQNLYIITTKIPLQLHPPGSVLSGPGTCWTFLSSCFWVHHTASVITTTLCKLSVSSITRLQHDLLNLNWLTLSTVTYIAGIIFIDSFLLRNNFTIFSHTSQQMFYQDLLQLTIIFFIFKSFFCWRVLSKILQVLCCLFTNIYTCKCFPLYNTVWANCCYSCITEF